MRTLIAAAISLACVTTTHAFDSKNWNHDAATSQWFKSLRNSRGESCCDGADGVRLEAPDWRELPNNSFEVFARDKWNQIPPDRVLKGTNRVGYAILWWPKGLEKPTCFLPGVEN